MNKNRLEAFSDGVIAIIITIMVLELKVPHGDSLAALKPIIPTAIGYVLSFIYVGIYWNNHHHTMQAVKSVNGSILWANLHLLFWLSIVPFGTSWLGENHFGRWPMIFYGFILIMNAVAYTILTVALINHHGKDSLLAKALGKDRKGKTSLFIYALAIALAWFNPYVSFGLYVLVAVIWFIPDSRIERQITSDQEPTD